MKSQYEQQCNAEALQQLGVAVMKSLKKKHRPVLQEWLSSSKISTVNYPDNISQIIDEIFRNHLSLTRVRKIAKAA